MPSVGKSPSAAALAAAVAAHDVVVARFLDGDDFEMGKGETTDSAMRAALEAAYAIDGLAALK